MRGLKEPALGFALGKDPFRPLSRCLSLSLSVASLSIARAAVAYGVEGLGLLVADAKEPLLAEGRNYFYTLSGKFSLYFLLGALRVVLDLYELSLQP